MFKKRKEEKQRLEEFKKSIKGIFDDWEVDRHNAKKGRYSLWIANGIYSFEDYGNHNFLKCFSQKERELLWEEFQNRGFPDGRTKIFKEFNLKGEITEVKKTKTKGGK
jgi:hypothetical protein